MSGLAIAFGMVIGLTLGLTGGGGSIFAVPLLVYGLGVAPHEAAGVSLAAVGATALLGTLERLRAGEVELMPGLLFSVGGVVGAPAGAWIGSLIPGSVLMLGFTALMLLVAVNLWRKSARKASEECPPQIDGRPACRRDEQGRLILSSRCMIVLALAGAGTGVLAGLFGVGGGFVIVPALVYCAGMSIHRAVATSLLAITLVSASGVASHLLAGRSLPWDIVAAFVAGGVAGMVAGTVVGRRLPAARLQRVFAGAVVAVAAFVIVRSVI